MSPQDSAKASRCLAKAASEQQGSKSLHLVVKQRNTKLETKTVPEKPCFLDNFPQKTRLKGFLLNSEVTLTLKGCWGLFGDSHSKQFSRWRVIEKYRKGQKQLKKIATHKKSTSAKHTIYDRPCPEKLPTASLDNPVVVTKPSSLSFFVQPDKKFFGDSTKVKETYFLTTFGTKYMRKIAHIRDLQKN